MGSSQSAHLGLIILSLTLFCCILHLALSCFPKLPHLSLHLFFRASRSVAIDGGLTAGVVIVQSSKRTQGGEDDQGVAAFRMSRRRLTGS